MTAPNRPHGAAVYLGLKAAMRRLVRQCGGTEAAALVTRARKSNLSDYQNPNTALFPPVDVVADLEADAGEPMVSRALARLSGHVLVPVVAPADATAWAIRLARVGKEASDVFGRASAALADGTLDRGEAGDLIHEIDEAITAFAQLRGAVMAVQEDTE